MSENNEGDGSLDTLGYNPSTVLPFKWILYSKDLTPKIKEKHLLSATLFPSDKLHAILSDITHQETGITNIDISASSLQEQVLLVGGLRKLTSNWKPESIKMLFNGHCPPPDLKSPHPDDSKSSLRISHCTVDKCCYGATDVIQFLCYAPVIGITRNIHEIPRDSNSSRVSQQLESQDSTRKRKLDGQSQDVLPCSSKRLKLDENFVNISQGSTSNKPCYTSDDKIMHHERLLIHQEVSYFAPNEEREKIDCWLKDSTTSTAIDTSVTNSTFISPLPLDSSKQTAAAKTSNTFPSAPGNVPCGEDPPALLRMRPPVEFGRLLAFTSVLVKRIVPLPLFGSVSNRRNFLKAVKRLLMAGRKDVLYLECVMHNVNVAHCRWAHGLRSPRLRSCAVAKLMVWLLQRVVLSTIHSFLYATESHPYNNMILYYHKNVWGHLTDLALNQLAKRHSILLVKKNDLQRPPSAGSTAVSSSTSKKNRTHPRIRFIPKYSGLRPIFPVKSAGSTPKEILQTRVLLNFIIKKYEGGSVGIRKSQPLRQVWSNYMEVLNSLSPDHCHLFVVKVDVADAFGSVLHHLLLDLIHKVSTTLPAVVHFGVYAFVNNRGIPGKYKHHILLDNWGGPTEPIRRKNRTMIEVDRPLIVNVSKTVGLIKAYIQHQVISAGSNRKYLVTKGIAQGGKISSQLCELYYSAMCNQHWKVCAGAADLLMHSVDDFIFVSPNRAAARKFLELSSQGVPAFNCYINPSKTIHNVGEADGPVRVPFCGLTLCSSSRQLLVSAALVASYPPRYSLTIDSSGRHDQFVAKRLLVVTMARLPASVLHPGYTSAAGLLCNVHRAAVMAGARLEAMCSTLQLQRGSIGQNAADGRFLGGSVMNTAHQVWKRIRTVWRRNTDLPLPVSRDQVVLTYIGAVSCALCLKGHVVLAELQKSLQRLYLHYGERQESQ